MFDGSGGRLLRGDAGRLSAAAQRRALLDAAAPIINRFGILASLEIALFILSVN
jgi:hypothetical protein